MPEMQHSRAARALMALEEGLERHVGRAPLEQTFCPTCLAIFSNIQRQERYGKRILMAELENDFILSGQSSQKPITVAVVIVCLDSPAEAQTNFRGKWAWSRGRLTLKPKILLASLKSCLSQPLQLSSLTTPSTNLPTVGSCCSLCYRPVAAQWSRFNSSI